MATDTPFTLRWGIMATGWIAACFGKDLLADPACRGVSDVRHEIVAVAASNSADKAADFIKRIEGPSSAKYYGSYREMVTDPNVDIIYIATPHSHHFQNAMLCLEAGKNVLCEKPITVTASQAKKLVETAKSKSLFLMEAVWIRFFPLSIKIREMINSGVIGKVHRTFADLSDNTSDADGILDFHKQHRMINLDLAGGALLDKGLYSLTWVFQSLYHTQPSKNKEAPTVISGIIKYLTGVDEQTSVICQFPRNRLVGIATTSLRVATDPDGHNSAGAAIRIQGTRGEIQVMPPAFRPLQYRVINNNSQGSIEVVDCPIPTDPKRSDWGYGMFWEADECARCLREGKCESSIMPWSESVLIMGIMESVLKEGGVEYPELITTDFYSPKSRLNIGDT